MTKADPNQELRRGMGLSTAIILNSVVGLIIIGVGVTGPA
jgi:hypothetical protein